MMKYKVFIVLTLIIALTIPSFTASATFADLDNAFSAERFDFSDIAITTFVSEADKIQIEDKGIVISKTDLVNSFDDTRNYVHEKLILVPEDQNTLEDIENKIVSIQSSSGGSNYKYIWDETYMVKAFMTVNYQNTTIGDDTYIAITSVTGGFEGGGVASVVGSGVSVTSHYLNVGQNGRSMSDGLITNQNVYNITFPIPPRTWSYTPPSSWVAVNEETVFTTVGASYTLHLKRGSETWSVYLDIPLAINADVEIPPPSNSDIA